MKFKKSTINNVKFINSDELYQRFIDKDSTLVKIHDMVDFDYYLPTIEDLYSEQGRPAHYAIMMFKLCLLQYFKGGLSDREVIAQAKTNLEYRYFLDLSVDDKLPHFTKLGTFRKRLGQEKFKKLFDEFVCFLKEQNAIRDQELRFMDATHQLADVTLVSINRLLAQACKNISKKLSDHHDIKISLDLDQSDFNLSEVERKDRFVELISFAQSLLEQAEKTLKTVEDHDLRIAYQVLQKIVKQREKKPKGNSTKKNKRAEGKIGSTVDPDATWGAKSKKKTFLGYKHNATVTEGGFVEVISIHQGHKADEDFLEEDIKKSDGNKFVGDSKYGTRKNRKTCQEAGKILVAPHRKNMKAHLEDELMDEVFCYNKTEQYKVEMKKRGSVIEGVFGVMKEVHNFARAKYRGLKKVSIQGLITAYVINLKALIKWVDLA